MKDVTFIETVLKRGLEARERVTSGFANLSREQFNWKPSPMGWSMAECLDHLVISHSLYFPVLKKISEGTFTNTFWEKFSPLSGFFGYALKDQLKEQVKRKSKTSPKLVPSSSVHDLDFIEKYHRNLDTFLTHISACKYADLDKIVITSPLLSFVTYSLRDAFEFLSTHEHRHIGQALRVKENANFPG